MDVGPTLVANGQPGMKLTEVQLVEELQAYYERGVVQFDSEEAMAREEEAE